MTGNPLLVAGLVFFWVLAVSLVGPVGGCPMSRQGRNLKNPNRLFLPLAKARTRRT